MLPERWVVFALLFAARTTIAFQFQAPQALGPLLLDGLIGDYQTLGILVGIYMLPGVALAFPGGLLDQNFGAKRVLLVGLALMVVGGLAMAAHSQVLLFAGRLVSGSGAALLNVVLSRAVSIWFVGRELTLAMGIFVASWPLGIALALILLPSLMVNGGWAAAMLASAVLPVCCLGLVAFRYREDEGLPRPAVTRLRPEISRRSLVLAATAGAVWGLYNVTYVVLVGALPDLFVNQGKSAAEAAATASILGWVLILSLPVGGYVAQRLTAPIPWIAGFLVAVAASAAGIAASGGNLVSLLLFPILFGFPAGLIMATAAQMLPPAHRPAGMGVYFTMFYFLMAVLPGVAGLIREFSFRPESPAYFAAVTAAAAAAAALLLARFSPAARPEGDRSAERHGR
jgi:cyanate permease